MGVQVKTFDFANKLIKADIPVEKIKKIADKISSDFHVKKIPNDAIKAKFATGNFFYKKAFKSFEEGFEYAKQKAIKALHTSKPYEHVVILDDTGNVLSEQALGKIGGNLNLLGTFFAGKGKKLIAVHGHPGEKTTPVSVTDFICLAESKINKIFAFDKNGKFSSLELLENFDRKKFNQANLLKKYITEALDNPALAHEYEMIQKTKNAEISKIFWKKLSQAEKNTPNYPQKIHEFWQKNAAECGVKYETNFEHLI